LKKIKKKFILPFMDFGKHLDKKILQQAIRDIASKNLDISTEAIEYFQSESFKKLCMRYEINSENILEAVKNLYDYPLVSRKILANEINRMVDSKW